MEAPKKKQTTDCCLLQGAPTPEISRKKLGGGREKEGQPGLINLLTEIHDPDVGITSFPMPPDYRRALRGGEEKKKTGGLLHL